MYRTQFHFEKVAVKTQKIKYVLHLNTVRYVSYNDV
jgi:hypothetical protein